ncbi:unnamed protein product [Blepharisma stoltei]|uniref:non-specific serine/threonine protein kinase n=1 Tax=Blepharisma stoltei TaxID=1481888 RepID=A0AAU9IVP9_9CILI|nr:unnamed protein product [Blepharisma stoltei]
MIGIKNLLKRFNYGMQPRLYANVNKGVPGDFYNYEFRAFEIGRLDDYEIVNKLGQGKYAEVYEGVNLLTYDRVTIKFLRQVGINKIAREISILKTLTGHPSIPRFIDIVRDRITNTPALIIEYSIGEDFRELYNQWGDFDVRYYMYEILKTLDYCHSKGVIHRDIKPHNIMFDHPKRKIRIIDWGLAEYYIHGHPYHVRVASRYFKGPELLVGHRYYNYSLDSWSLACMMAGIVFKKEPFFQGEDNEDQLMKIIAVLGSEALGEYIAKHRVDIDRALEKKIVYQSKQSLNLFVTNENSHLANPQAIDLLSKLFVYDHIDRLLPKEAMGHPYFDIVRKMWEDIENSVEIDESEPYALTAKIIRQNKSHIH